MGASATLILESGRGPLSAPPAPLVAGATVWSAAIGGLDGNFGQGFFCLIQCCLLGWVLLSDIYSSSTWQRTKPIFVMLAAAWLWSIYATWAFSGIITEEAYARMSRNFGAMALLLTGLLLSRVPRQRERILDWIAILIAMISLVAIVAWSADPMTLTWATGLDKQRRFQGFVGNVNVNATISAVGALWAGWRGMRVWSTWHNWTIRQRLLSVVLVVAFLVHFTTVLLSATRFVNFLLCAVLLLGVATHILWRKATVRPTRRHIIILAVMLLLLLASQLWSLVGQRYASIDDGVMARLIIWQQCLKIALQRPLTGYGLGSFPAVYAHFLPGPRRASMIWTVNSPHNVLIQALLTGGLVYLGLLAGAALMILRPIVHAIRTRASVEADHMLCIMLTVMLGSASIDIALDYPLSIGLFAMLLGLLLGHALYRRKIPVADTLLQATDHKGAIGRRHPK